VIVSSVSAVGNYVNSVAEYRWAVWTALPRAVLLTAGCAAVKAPDLKRLHTHTGTVDDQPPVILIHGVMGSGLREMSSSAIGVTAPCYCAITSSRPKVMHSLSNGDGCCKMESYVPGPALRYYLGGACCESAPTELAQACLLVTQPNGWVTVETEKLHPPKSVSCPIIFSKASKGSFWIKL